MKANDAKRLKELEAENARLKKQLARRRWTRSMSRGVRTHAARTVSSTPSNDDHRHVTVVHIVHGRDVDRR